MMRQLFAQKSNGLGCKISRLYPLRIKKTQTFPRYPARTTTSSCNEMPYQAFDLISLSFQELAVFSSACTNLSVLVVCWSDLSKMQFWSGRPMEWVLQMDLHLLLFCFCGFVLPGKILQTTLELLGKFTYLVVRGKTCWYSTDAVTTPCGGVSSLETLGGFRWQFFLLLLYS